MALEKNQCALFRYEWTLPSPVSTSTKVLSDYIQFHGQDCFRLGISHHKGSPSFFTFFFYGNRLHRLGGVGVQSVACTVDGVTFALESRHGSDAFVMFKSERRMLTSGFHRLTFSVSLKHVRHLRKPGRKDAPEEEEDEEEDPDEDEDTVGDESDDTDLTDQSETEELVSEKGDKDEKCLDLVADSSESGSSSGQSDSAEDGQVSGYNFELVDELLLEQLWAASRLKQRTDFEYAVKHWVFAAHKIILSARSQLLVGPSRFKTLDNQMIITGVDPAVFEYFLEFVYTGRLRTTPSDQLMDLAVAFDLKALVEICEKYKEVDERFELLQFLETAERKSEDEFTVVQGEVRVLRGGLDHRFTVPSFSPFPYVQDTRPHKLEIDRHMLLVTLKSKARYDGHHKSCLNVCCQCGDGSRVINVGYALNKDCPKFFMKDYSIDSKSSINLFKSTLERTKKKTASQIYLNVHFVSGVDRYNYQLMDANLQGELWASRHSVPSFTDVEIQTVDGKLKAHRVVLAARSPIMAEHISHYEKSEKREGLVIRIEEVEAEIVENFLYFIYMGTLLHERDLGNDQMLILARLYKVETLEWLCRGVAEQESVVNLSEKWLTSVD